MLKILRLLSLTLICFSYLAAENPEEIWLDELRGLVFTGEKRPISSFDEAEVDGIEISNVWVPDKEAFIRKMSDFLGQSISETTIEQIKQSVVRFYQKRGYFIVTVFVPADQDITNGILQVTISVGRIGKIKSEGAKYFSNQSLKSKMRLKSGEFIRKEPLLSGLNWINQNPFRSSSFVLEPGEDFGETDVTLSTKDRFPLRVYGGYQNTGNQIAGSSRFLTGINWGNAFGLDHQLNYLFIFSPENLNKWQGQSGSYIAPLPWRHVFEAYASFTKSKPNVDTGFDLTGKSWTLAGRYKIPFQVQSLKNTFFVGYEFKRSNNFLTFSEALLFDKYIDISQFLVSHEIESEYSRGKSKLGVVLYLSPGKMTSFNKDENFAEERDGTKSNYIYGRAHVEQTTFLPAKLTWLIDALFQQATGKLLPTEQFSLGGFFTVRGYDENEVIGDNGILIKNEIYAPTVNLPPKEKNHQLKVLGFVDYGWTYDVNQNILSKDVTALASIGPGLQYNFENYVSVIFYYGFQLKTIRRIEDPSSKHSRTHLSAIIAF